MALITVSWQFSEEEKDNSPFAVDGEMYHDLTHMNELAILMGKASTNFFEQPIEVRLLPEGHNIYFSSKELGPQKIEGEKKEFKVH